MEPLRIMRWIITRRAVFAGHLSPRTALDYPQAGSDSSESRNRTADESLT